MKFVFVYASSNYNNGIHLLRFINSSDQFNNIWFVVQRNNEILSKVSIYNDKISHYTWKVNDETTKVNCMIINCYGFWKVFISKWQSYTIAQFVKAGNICSNNLLWHATRWARVRERNRERGERENE